MNKDRIYSQKLGTSPPPFKFNKNVADAFDDMVHRSVPIYEMSQNAIADIIEKTIEFTGPIYDLGCSTGTTLYTLASRIKSDKLRQIGVDSSEAMVQKCKERLSHYNLLGKIDVYKADILKLDYLAYGAPEFVIMNYVLQFIKPSKKQKVLDDIYQAISSGSSLILSDKIVPESEDDELLFQDIYYDYKRSQGYSELEIAQKREALESVLIPHKVSTLEKMLHQAGFVKIEIILKWFNFVTIYARK